MSKTGDPTGQYWRYEFKISDTKLNDYPKFGVWPTGYFMSVNQFAGNSFAGAGLVAFERDKMLHGQRRPDVLRRHERHDARRHAAVGSRRPDAAARRHPELLHAVRRRAGAAAGVEVRRELGHTTVTGAFTKVTNLPVAAFDSNMCNYARSCIPQSGTSRKLDAISDRLMYRLQYRNFGGYETFVTNHTVDVNDTTARASAGTRCAAPAARSACTSRARGRPMRRTAGWPARRWIQGRQPRHRLQRLIGHDLSLHPLRGAPRGRPARTLAQGEQDILAGVGSQTSTSSRWGDYSNLVDRPERLHVLGDARVQQPGDRAQHRPVAHADRGVHAAELRQPQNRVGDFDGDGLTDLAVFRPSTSTWDVRNVATVQFGAAGDIPVPSDYNGDGVIDVAVYRPSTGQWFVRNQFTVQLGLPSDIPVPGDYNGDGVTDVAVYRPSTGQWFVRNQFSGAVRRPERHPGARATTTATASTDVAVYRPSTGQWFVRNQFTVQFGDRGRCAGAGRLQRRRGDGRRGLPAVDGAVVRAQPVRGGVGDADDMPVPGDYNGDGATDIAVYRPSTGQWFVRNQFTVQWGQTGDMPVVQP